MRIGTRVTFTRCHRLHKAHKKVLVGQSGVIVGRTPTGEMIVVFDNGVMTTLCPQWLAVELQP
jgi:hypothetical protein